MPDPRFFKKTQSFTLSEIADSCDAQIVEGGNPDFRVEDVASLDSAGASDLTFLDNVKYKDQFRITKAGACFVDKKVVQDAPKGMNLLVSDTPYKSYALAAQKFYPQDMPSEDISAQAHIDPAAQIGPGCVIEAGVVVKSGAKIGKQCWIEAGAIVEQNVEIGSYCRIGSNSSISHALIGDYVHLYPGVRIGQDGFGFAIDPKGFVKVPQLGRVIIGDHVEIGANACIDRGSGPDTVIGQGTWIDNLVQIGHNVKVGKGCVLVAQVGISGSTVIEDYVVIGGQAGVAGHLNIGKGARIGAKTGVMKNIPAGEDHIGFPSMPSRDFMRQVATLKRLIKKEKTS